MKKKIIYTLIIIFVLGIPTAKCEFVTLEQKMDLLNNFMINKNYEFFNFVQFKWAKIIFELESKITESQINSFLQNLYLEFILEKNIAYEFLSSLDKKIQLFNQLIVNEDPKFLKFCQNSKVYIISKLDKFTTVNEIQQFLNQVKQSYEKTI